MSQAQSIEFNTSQANIERLRCSVCNRFLSCTPILLLRDGSNACGRCSGYSQTPNYINYNKRYDYRQVILEAILSDTNFPCSFAKYGCTARLLFETTVDHEARCEFRPLTCALQPCSWNGPAGHVFDHFAKQHPSCVKQDLEFAIEVNVGQEGVLVVKKHGTTFLVRYTYNAANKHLNYSIRYLYISRHIYCKVKLINYFDRDYMFQCSTKSELYNENSGDDTIILKLNKFLKGLDRPMKLTVAFDVDSFINSTDQFALTSYYQTTDILQTIEFNTSQVNIERLRCSMCEHFLSCSPILLLREGSNICGRCSLSCRKNDYRQVTLEAILGDATFPCSYAKYGCTARLLFGTAVGHEASCDSRPLACALQSCSWKGPAEYILDHFAEQHGSCLKQDLEFTLEVNLDQSGILVVKRHGTAFLVEYVYNAKNNLTYSIRYFGNFREELCNVKLINPHDLDYTFQFKGNKCTPYNQIVHNVLDFPIHFLKRLNNPTKVTVAFDFDSAISANQLAVDYTLLESHKCKTCQYYLIPPIYDNGGEVICCDCRVACDGCEPFEIKTLTTLLGSQNYPCRWRGCDFIGKALAIRAHELQCEFRTYRCSVAGCEITFSRTGLAQHLKEHNYSYFAGECVFKMSFENDPDNSNLFTVVENEIITMKCCSNHLNYYHYIFLQTCTRPEFACIVQFEHSHCKCKSKYFDVGNNNKTLYVCLEDLPSCFRVEDELTVTLKIT